MNVPQEGNPLGPAAVDPRGLPSGWDMGRNENFDKAQRCSPKTNAAILHLVVPYLLFVLVRRRRGSATGRRRGWRGRVIGVA